MDGGRLPGRAVLISAFTVAASMAGMYLGWGGRLRLLRDRDDRGCALAMLGSLTVLPGAAIEDG